MFSYPKFNKQGTKIVSSTNGRNKNMLMDITVHILKKDEAMYIMEENSETAILLLKGKISLDYENNVIEFSRKDVFSEMPSCLHICKGIGVVITAFTDAEILIQGTENGKIFESKVYYPQDIQKVTSCKGKWDDTARREVVTVFDYENAPYSNMVLGEIFVPEGRWYSYIPHSHPQPEVYYYKFVREEGFGACFIGEKAYTVKDGSCGAFPGGKTHAQVTAPGYPAYCCWMIRHLDGNPWRRTRIDDDKFVWLLNEKQE